MNENAHSGKLCYCCVHNLQLRVQEIDRCLLRGLLDVLLAVGSTDRALSTLPQRHDVCWCNDPPRAARRPCMHAFNACLLQFSAIVDSPIGSNAASDLWTLCDQDLRAAVAHHHEGKQATATRWCGE